jgi:hypothetical protein
VRTLTSLDPPFPPTRACVASQVEERERNAVGAVDNALTSVFTFALYACSLHVASPEQFARVTWASACAVCASAVVFSGYLALWHEHPHEHEEDEVEQGVFRHAHTTQQVRALELGARRGPAAQGKGKAAHVHVHFAGPSHLLGICGGGGGALSGGEVHDHTHDHGHSHAHM